MRHIALITASMIMASTAFAGPTPAPANAEVYFIGLEDGSVVEGPVTVRFGLRNMGVAPAGVEKDNAGHHHLLVNRPPLGEGEDGADEFEYSLPADENHIHFGGGQTETVIDLPPGTHTLQLVLGDANHIPHATPVVSPRITITVK